MKRTQILVIRATLAIILTVSGIPVVAAEFTAVLFSIHPNGDIYPEDTLTPNFWVKGNVYRYEGNYQERPIIIISNMNNDKAWFLDVEQKTYLEVTRSEGGVPDPIQMWEFYFSGLKKDSLGEEKIKGYPCRKYKYVADNGVEAVQWVSDSLGLYIKHLTHYSETTWTSVEMVNIKEQPVDSSLFDLPEGYVDVKSIPPDERKQRRVKIRKKP